jgi:hypothetical protein
MTGEVHKMIGLSATGVTPEWARPELLTKIKATAIIAGSPR